MACSIRSFGVAVIGIGIAGRVRLRDLQECNLPCYLELKGFVSRRDHIDIPGVTKLTFEECLARSDIHAVIICTEPDTHEDLIRQALSSNKHVLVEYPVALSSQVARNLYKQAKDKVLVLHEENIRLLTESHKSLKQMAAKENLKCARSSLTGSYNGWVEKLPLEGKPFVSSVSAIQAFYDIFGDMRAVGASLEVEDDCFNYTGNFITKDSEKNLTRFFLHKADEQKGSILKAYKEIKVLGTLLYDVAILFNMFSLHREVVVSRECRKQKTQRHSHTYVEFESGLVFDTDMDKSSITPSKQKPGLFEQDLKLFAAELQGEHTTECRSAMSIRSLEIAEEADAFIKISA